MAEQFRWVIETDNGHGKIQYIKHIDYTGRRWIFEFVDKIEDALRYPIEKRAYDECDFLTRRGGSRYKKGMSKFLEPERTFKVLDVGAQL